MPLEPPRSDPAIKVPAELAAAALAPAPAGSGAAPAAKLDLEKLLRAMAKYEASDLHLKVGAPPILRIADKLRNLESAPFQKGEIEQMLEPFLTIPQLGRFQAGHDLDIAISLGESGRYRINAFRQRGQPSLAVRRVRMEVPTFEQLHLPGETLRSVANNHAGLVLVCGITGSGKSTTLAAMLEHINETRRAHIVTIEDPIEYLYRDKKSFVNQREVGIDVEDFHAALKSVVRQDPDVILVGEMRDRETFEAGLAAAETGHLVFGTLHSATVGATIGRILDLFPAEREKQVRQALRFNLRAIVCQKILPSIKKGVAVVPALEILIATSTVGKVIAEGEDQKLETIVRGGGEEGMVDFNTSLIRLVKEAYIAERTALEASANPEQLKMNLKGIFLGDDRKIIG
ncbi:MAG TPA: PilT/PilU family type 4a pilus ATPase [Planctomycetota bacterium]|nr:PilT/PilU family type 4a pilus ATPase [Planctomycetota bacterium]